MTKTKTTTGPLVRLTVLCAVCVASMGVPAAHARKAKRAMILLYDGFGTPQKARLWGRVVEDKGFDAPEKNERWTRRLKRSVRLLESDEVPGARVALSLAGRARQVVADAEGLFALALPGLPLGRHALSARLIDPTWRYRIFAGEVVVVRPGGGVGVISDVDDTVLDTRVKKKLRMLKHVLFDNAHSLETFPGAPGLYRALVGGGAPLIFVSGSPHNLYPRLRRFLRIKGFPRGALRLKNLGTSRGSDALRDQVRYKLARIREVMALLPGWRFILIGDSGEKDPEIYREAQRRYPGRVAAVLIRNTGKADPRDARFSGQRLFDRFSEAGRYLRRRRLLGAVEVKRP